MESNSFESYLMPTLTVSNCEAAVMFYKAAFNAVEEFSDLEIPGSGFAVLRIGAALLVVADQSPANGNVSPVEGKGISIRMGLMVADPDVTAQNAIDLGAREIYPVTDQEYGYRLGHIVDPFGHHWEIGRPLKNKQHET
jgi:PhnB protein